MNDVSSSSPSFGRWLKRLRAQHDLTQEALAELAYCSVQTIRFFESGKRRPSLEMAERLAEVLGVPADQHSQFIKLARTSLNAQEPNGAEVESVTPPSTAAVSQPTTENIAPTPPVVPTAARLPVPTTILVGRQPEAERLEQLLVQEGQRLVTLMGPGGIGKTRLALHMAHMLDSRFPNGAIFVPLVSISNSVELPTAIANAMHKSLPGDSASKAQLDALFADQTLLLVLDNFEHLLAHDGDVITELIDHILQHSPGVHMLVTSRERLRLPAERVFELGGLAVPQALPDMDPLGDEIVTSDAVILFLQRARQVAPSFSLTRTNRAAIVRLCNLLGGMPLGIELAAAWLRTLTPEEIADEIARSLDFLTLADRGVPARHRSLRAAFEHSWKLLSPEEQKIAARLSIFRGGFRREGAQAVASASLPALAALIDKSLVQVVAETVEQDGAIDGPQKGALRYEIHELLRQYLRAKLVELGEEDAIARRHVEYFMGMAEKVDAQHYATMPHSWFKQLRAEQGNLRAAMEWSLSGRNAPDLGMRMVAALGRFWYMGDAWKEGREWLNAAQAAIDETTPPAIRAAILMHLGDLEHAMAEYALGKRHLEEALDIWRAIDDAPRTAWTLFQLGVLHSTITDFAKSEEIFNQALAIYRQLDEPWFVALVLMQLASTMLSASNFERAAKLLDEAVPLFRAQEPTNVVAVSLNMLGWVQIEQGNFETAIEHYQEALSIGQIEGNLQSIGWSLRNLGMGHTLLGRFDEAEQYLRSCLRIYHQISFKSGMVIAFEILARVAAEQGEFEQAVRWMAVADTTRNTIGLPRTAGDERFYYGHAQRITTNALSPEVWNAAWAQGSRLTLDEAIEAATQDRLY